MNSEKIVTKGTHDTRGPAPLRVKRKERHTRGVFDKWEESALKMIWCVPFGSGSSRTVDWIPSGFQSAWRPTEFLLV